MPQSLFNNNSTQYQCVVNMCCPQFTTCAGSPDCVAVEMCFAQNCTGQGQNPNTCKAQCEADASSTGSSDFNAGFNCVIANCFSGGGDGGGD